MLENFTRAVAKRSPVKSFKRGEKQEKIEPQAAEAPPKEHRHLEVKQVPFEKTPEYVELKVHLHQEIIESINLSAIDKMSRDDIESEIGEVVNGMIASENIPLNTSERSKQLIKPTGIWKSKIPLQFKHSLISIPRHWESL